MTAYNYLSMLKLKSEFEKENNENVIVILYDLFLESGLKIKGVTHDFIFHKKVLQIKK